MVKTPTTSALQYNRNYKTSKNKNSDATEINLKVQHWALNNGHQRRRGLKK